MIRRHVGLSQEFAAWVAADDRFEVVAPHPLNLVCLRVRGTSPEDGDVRTDALIDAANATGQALFTRTVLDGRSVLRMSIGGRATERRHVEAAWGLLRSRA
jgi:aromatic-L-amino-acid decarboxylase